MTQVSSLYLHVPYCLHLCNYCDFYKRSFDRPKEQIEEFHQFLNKSWQRHEIFLQDHNTSWSPLETIYLGGGTPSLWGSEGAEYIQKNILTKIQVKDPEFTMEVDPGTWNPEMMKAWRDIGLNRISIGTQSLDENFLTIMDRKHSLAESHELLTYCDKEDLNFSLDFLLGIPFSQEKKRDIKSELDQLLAHHPKHISLYILNARSHYPHIQHLPDDEYIREEYLLVADYLKSLGFHHYEVSNFALPGFESKHNQRYWQNKSVAALGPTATGYLALSKDKAIRYKWKVSQAEFETEILTEKELDLEETYLHLRTSKGWMPKNTAHYHSLFMQWQKQGYGELKSGRMTLNSMGFLMLDSLMDDLFRL